MQATRVFCCLFLFGAVTLLAGTQAGAQENARLDIDGVGTMLENMGHDVASGQYSSGRPYQKISINESGIRFSIYFNISGSKENIWLSQDFTTWSKQEHLPEDFYLNLLQKNLEIGPSHFSILADGKTLRLSYRVPNNDVTPKAMRTAVRKLVEDAKKTELLFLALIGASAGIVLGYFIAAALLPDVAATLRGLYGANITGTLSLRADWWLTGLAIALLGTGAAMADKLWQVARMPILASARPRAWAQATAKGRRLQAGLSAAFFVTALALALFGEGLLAGFALQGALLVGAALALPVLLHVVLTLIERRTRNVTWHWFWADTRQQVPGLSLALMALLLAVSANIGVSTMVSSFRLTFVEFLDQRLASELYVNVADAEQSAEVEQALLTHAQEVMPLLGRPARAEGMAIDLDGIRVGETYRRNWRFLAAAPEAWDRVAAGEAMLANEQFARRADKSFCHRASQSAGGREIRW